MRSVIKFFFYFYNMLSFCKLEHCPKHQKKKRNKYVTKRSENFVVVGILSSSFECR